LRVALPVDPHFKTESEAATLMFLAEKTSLPVPKVLAYSSTQENELGFEWILMQRMPGGVLEERHLSITWEMKVELVKTVARHISELGQHSFTGIGNLYLQRQPHEMISEPNSSHSTEYQTGRIADMDFFWIDRIHQDVPRGPFSNCADFFDARLLLVINESRAKLDSLHSKKAAIRGSKQANSAQMSKDQNRTCSNPAEAPMDTEADNPTGDKDVEKSHYRNSEHEKHGAWDSDDETAAEEAQESLDLALKLKRRYQCSSHPPKPPQRSQQRSSTLI
jgi:Phosphotransferase enzyme family